MRVFPAVLEVSETYFPSKRSLTRCRPISTAILTAIPVVIHSADSLSGLQLEGDAAISCDLPFPWLIPARSASALTVFREGTESIEPIISRATLRKTLPYSCGCKCGRAIQGWLENLSSQPRPSLGSAELTSPHYTLCS